MFWLDFQRNVGGRRVVFKIHDGVVFVLCVRVCVRVYVRCVCMT